MDKNRGIDLNVIESSDAIGEDFHEKAEKLMKSMIREASYISDIKIKDSISHVSDYALSISDSELIGEWLGYCYCYMVIRDENEGIFEESEVISWVEQIDDDSLVYFVDYSCGYFLGHSDSPEF